MKIAFCTDIHLDHLKETKARDFIRAIVAAKPDAVISTGDMSGATELNVHLGWFREILDGIPLYFVLGNHDFYRGSIAGVRHQFRKLSGWAKTGLVMDTATSIEIRSVDELRKTAGMEEVVI
jgi:predicted MPP superfamily phosphohydrolase